MSQIFDCPNLLNETLLSLNEAASKFPVRKGRAVLERWMRRGVRGVVLESVLIGYRRYTSAEAIQRFLAGQQRIKEKSTDTQQSMSRKEIAAAREKFGLPTPIDN